MSRPKFNFFFFLISNFSFLFSPLSVHAAGIFGTVENPAPAYGGSQGEGLFVFLSNVLKFAGVIAGIFFIIQIIVAGFNYISASGDIKKTEAAWGTIWQSIVGMVIIASAFVIASLVEKFTGISILKPTIYGP